MPLLTVKMNVSASGKGDELLELLTDAIAKSTGKPKAYVSVILDDDKTMSFGGTTAPCAMISLGRNYGASY